MAEASREMEWTGLGELREDLERYLARRCRDAHEIDDVVQETLLRAARYRHRLTSDDRLRAWAARIATNVLLDRRRGEARLRWSADEVDLADACSEPDSTEEPANEIACSGWAVGEDVALELLEQELAAMAVDDRRMLITYYGGNESCADVAGVCQLGPNVVKARLFRARRRLLRALKHRFSLAASGRWTGAQTEEQCELA